ncbi:Transketolase, thiamine diphosphate binding domain-containing protein [Cladophialophora immunda]|nr:Transketolase, thiamine diphosphate binding domain-containing protein [Cladophialophora immunda]
MPSIANGHSGAANGVTATPVLTDDDQAVRDLRKFIIDVCRQNGGGHGGSAIGMAPLGVALWRHTMRYNPKNAEWFDRDRFVLSNGHAAMFIYTMLHVTGYPSMTLDEVKLYGSAKPVDPDTGKWKATLCHGHPELDVPGIEVTTGPLGQGVANAVGLAIASKHLAATFNKPGYEVVRSRIYCTTGDGCIQEGVAQEAMALAGHLKLDNLVLCYDNNQVTCDGPLDWIVSEDTNAKMRAIGWNVIDVFTGDSSVDDIVSALKLARSTKGKPTFINIRTTIGYGTSTAGTFKSHHGTYSDEDAALYASPSVSATHTLSEQTKAYLSRCVTRGQAIEDDWNALLSSYRKAYPTEAQRLSDRINGKVDYETILSTLQIPDVIQATRQFNGTVFNALMSHVPHLVAGGADLWNSNQMGDQTSRIFSGVHPEGRVIRYGIREHAMASISNGLAAYNPGTIIPITATFFMFYLYAAPGVRMGALSHLKVIHVATHDSIGEGQNGPTHQPVELDSLYRAMPHLAYIRPSDAEEVVGAWLAALGPATKNMSVIISLARDPAIIKVPNTDRTKVARGGYVVVENHDANVTLVSCGSELPFAVAAAKQLTEQHGISTRVVSMPCISLFEDQTETYQNEVLGVTEHVVSVEAYISSMWARFCTASVAMDDFGYSSAGIENFRRFGIDDAGIVRKVKKMLDTSILGKGKARWRLLK